MSGAIRSMALYLTFCIYLASTRYLPTIFHSRGKHHLHADLVNCRFLFRWLFGCCSGKWINIRMSLTRQWFRQFNCLVLRFAINPIMGKYMTKSR